MRRALCMILGACLLLTAAGCGSTEEEQAKSQSESEADTESENNSEIDSEESEDAEELEAETDEVMTTATEYEYDILLYSDDYVEITLDRATSDNIYFSITNVSDQVLQADCTYIQLDGVEYTYEYTEYAPPMLSFAAGDTREYEYRVDGIITIDEPVFSTITGLFGIWDEEGYLLEYANIPETLVGEEPDKGESDAEYEVLYSDDYVEIAVYDVQSNAIYFVITNTSDQVINVDCDYVQLDEIEYSLDGTGYGSSWLTFASGSTRIYEYAGITYEGEILFEVESTEYSEVSGVFNIWDGDTGELIERVSI